MEKETNKVVSIREGGRWSKQSLRIRAEGNLGMVWQLIPEPLLTKASIQFSQGCVYKLKELDHRFLRILKLF